MKRTWRSRVTAAGAVTSALLLAGAVGCAGDNVAADNKVDYEKAANAQPAADTQKPGEAPKPVDAFAEMPTPPADAQYTIYCQAYSGPDHQAVARQVRDLLRKNTSMGKWYVIHGDQQSTLYYGFYRTIDRKDETDAKEGQRAIDDLDAIRTLHDSRGVRLFSASLPVSINSPDPTTNPQWNIDRTGAYWTLDVATFKDTADRKQRAVEAVAEARKQGFDAYYHHGPHTSEVCIGAWPKKAAIEIDTAMQNVDPDRPLVVTQTPMSDEARKSMDPNIQTAAPQVDPVDPAMIAAIAQWPTHAVNGYVRMEPDPITHQATNVPLDRAFLFRVPDALSDTNGQLPTAEGSTPPGAIDTTAATIAPPAAPGSGRLRSLDDSR